MRFVHHDRGAGRAVAPASESDKKRYTGSLGASGVGLRLPLAAIVKAGANVKTYSVSPTLISGNCCSLPSLVACVVNCDNARSSFVAQDSNDDGDMDGDQGVDGDCQSEDECFAAFMMRSVLSLIRFSGATGIGLERQFVVGRRASVGDARCAARPRCGRHTSSISSRVRGRCCMRPQDRCAIYVIAV